MTDTDTKIDELRERVRDAWPLSDVKDDAFFNSEMTLQRYLQARDWNVDEAEKMLRATVDYRRQAHPLHADCKWCHEKPGYHSMRQVGNDKQGRPVLYLNFAQALVRKSTTDDSIAHFTYVTENAIRTMKSGVQSWVWVIDFTGMTISVINLRLTRELVNIMSNHYPEMLGLTISVNHGPIFQGLWKAIKVFLPASTIAKVTLLRSPEKNEEHFREVFSEELTTWLLEEIKINKVKPLSQEQIEFWKCPAHSHHDPRGCSSYIEEFLDTFDSKAESDLLVHKPFPNILHTLKGFTVNSPALKPAKTGKNSKTCDIKEDPAENCSTEEVPDESCDLAEGLDETCIAEGGQDEACFAEGGQDEDETCIAEGGQDEDETCSIDGNENTNDKLAV